MKSASALGTFVLGLVLRVMLIVASPSTRELLECRTNLTSAIKNETAFLDKVEEADYIFTGKIKEFKRNQLQVKVKRAIKGFLNGSVDLVVNDTCGKYIRPSYTGIFMGIRYFGTDNLLYTGKIVMHFGPVPLTLTNLDRLNAAVRGNVFFTFFVFIIMGNISKL